MKKIILLLVLMMSLVELKAQHRPFHNPVTGNQWIYNPAADFNQQSVFVGYQAEGATTYTPKSILLGVRALAMDNVLVGVQGMQISEDLIDYNLIAVNYSQRFVLNTSFVLNFNVGTGVYNTNINTGKLEYLDSNDPLLKDLENQYNLHVNAGFSLQLNEKWGLNFGLPYLYKQDELNFNEMLLNVGYHLETSSPLDWDFNVNFDRWNKEQIYGASMKANWKQTFSGMLGVDNFRTFAGISLHLNKIQMNYVYSQNHEEALSHLKSHQITLAYSLQRKPKQKGKSFEKVYEESVEKQQQLMDDLKKQDEELSESLQEMKAQQEELKKLSEEIKKKQEEKDYREFSVADFDSNESSIEKGGYLLVIASGKTKEELVEVVESIAPMGLETGIFLNKRTGFYYLFVDQYTSLAPALKRMKVLRAVGIKNSWVHIFK